MIRLRLAGLLLLSLLGAACSHYQAGIPSSNPSGSIFVAPVVNRSYAPQASALVAQDISESLLQSGAVLAANADEASLLLEITLTDYLREARATDTEDTGRRLSFGQRLRALVRLSVRETGETLVERSLEARGVAYTEPSLVESEYQALPQLSEDLARQVRDLVLNHR